MKTSLILALLGLLGTTLQAQITDPTYVNDFTSSSTDFTTAGPGSWTTNTTAPGYLGHNNAASVSGVYTASIQHSLLGGPSASLGFSFSATVDYTATGVASTNTLGVVFLAGSQNLATSNAYSIYIRGTVDGTSSIFLTRNNVQVASAGSSTNELRDYFGDRITFEISATYVDNALSIAATVINEDKSRTFSLSYVDNTPLEGNYFGMRANDASSSHTFNAQWDSFSLSTIPEPSAFATVAGLCGLAATTLLRRRRVSCGL